MTFTDRFPLVAIGCLVASALGPTTAGAATKVACVGDSITFGYQASASDSYPTVLGKMLGSGYQVSNYGQNSLTAQKEGNGYSYWNSGPYKDSLNSKADVVLLMLGTNDAKPENWKGAVPFEKDYKALLSQYQMMPSHPVVYILVPVPGTRENFSIKLNNLNDQIVPLIRKIAKDNNIPFIDVNAAFMDRLNLIGDGIHPTAAGYALIASTVFKALAASASADAGAGRDAGAVAADGGATSDSGVRGDVAPPPIDTGAADLNGSTYAPDNVDKDAEGAPTDASGSTVSPSAPQNGCAFASDRTPAARFPLLMIVLFSSVVRSRFYRR